MDAPECEAIQLDGRFVDGVGVACMTFVNGCICKYVLCVVMRVCLCLCIYVCMCLGQGVGDT